MEKYLLDTNVLIDNPDILYRGGLNFSVSYTTLKELDKLKNNPNIGHSVRTAIKILYEKVKLNEVEIISIPKELDDKSPDEKIILDAKSIDATLMTRDIGAKVIANSLGVKVYEEGNLYKDYDPHYKGYREYYLTDSDSEFYYSLTQNHYQYIEIEAYINEELEINEYCILYAPDSSNSYIIFKKKENGYWLVHQSTRPLRNVGIGIDFEHPEQTIAYDMIMDENVPLVVLSGKIGSGKTLLATVGALSQVATKSKPKYDKILVTRPPTPINKDMEIGFLPGSMDEKLSQWLAGFKSNLDFLFNTTKKAVEDNVAEKVFLDYFTPTSIESIQGASFNKKLLIVDEIQLLNSETLNQIMSRVAKGSKLILILDPEQTYGANRGNEGYKKLLPHCKGHKLVNYIRLQHIQRSELTQFIYEVFKS